ncbi:phosphonate metabolism protein/1,5-bisphosphokinase (PRPP-forming) PhnN [Stappia indica]|uniref:phosphonate metabolism protein/1,5-bisphosphokinase (PRPP-forming) PhnN n=1 Tax=Stappia indica TaxID=538381 RepID=UPI001CD4B13A|nr:phosphonate metabolism protein/1,5-bisphosphokinase (PRPP-forming) PhnN [Stappia indica]MCA1299372.1 phosphonate metabolism protein/1,5-bisphosphokinase (PRPP-forming) PhnN [Stappia indica]
MVTLDARAPGPLIVVVGPSGVGKDSLLAAARAAYAGRPEMLFVRRAITRPASGDAEDHLPMSAAEFEATLAGGGFCLAWRAHGLAYGLPAALRAHLDAGRPAVVNGSRRALPEMAECFENLAILSVTATPEVLGARLAGRGRESAEEIAARVARAAPVPPVAPIREIDNSGSLDAAVPRFLGAIAAFSGLEPLPRTA